MANLSKRRRQWGSLFDRSKKYEVAEALALLKQAPALKFDPTVEVAVNLGVDPKKSDQMVRGVAKLPHGTGRSVRILVFAKGEKADEAKAAGADIVGAEELIEKVSQGWLEFDKAIATPDMMAKIGPIAKILGPRGLMPNPKVGTVTQDVSKAVGEEKAGRVEFRVEKAGIVHAPIGKLSFSLEALVANFNCLVEQILKAKPIAAKGIYLQKMAVSSTMGPGIRLDVNKATVVSIAATGQE